MKKFRKKKDASDDFQKETTDGDLEAGALNKSGRDDEFEDAAKDEEKENKDKIIWFPREKKHFWR